ncbi:MAG: hypothetical protein VW885_07365 [Alphaproteobacteria bacterium]|nr:hypothetical protein [Pseudomonadota bacterium]|tara:strand:- start:669 stop:1844 length:1176 start_codon:yes stop_codon:yes gene_type:complete
MMIPTIKTAPTLFAALTATALLVFQPSLASARTTLQLDNGNVLSFSDGSIDMVTGSGELFDVSVVEYGEEVARAEYVRIDATGNLGQADWFVNELVADNLEAVEEGIFIGRAELRDIAMGMLAMDDEMVDYEQYLTPGTSVLLENIGMADEEALFSVDRVASLPFGFDLLNDGQQIVTNAGIEVDGFTMMPLDGSAAGSDPMFQKLAERGITDVGMDLKIASGVRLAGDSMTMFYGIEAAMRDLTEIRFNVALSMAQVSYSQLVPMLSSPEDNGAALLGLSGAVSLDAAEIVIDDRGLLDILFEIAAEEEGVSDGDMRTMARMVLASALQGTFPENAANLLPPIEALISQGGELQVLAQPGMPVPLSSSLGFMMLPDMAIQQLGITVTHMP